MVRRTWSLTELIAVAEDYPELGPRRLAARFRRSEDSVMGFARRLGLRSRHRCEWRSRTRAEQSHSVNSWFFSIPSPDVAYVLGVLSAWGSVKTHPRHVLKLRCPIRREPVLRTVLAMMRSKHRTQRGRQRVLVEVCNSVLVESMLAHYGQPPGRDDPDPPAVAITSDLIPDFALGLLDAGGTCDDREVELQGSSNVVAMIRDAIGTATGVIPAEENATGIKRVITYRGQLQIMAVKRWLPARRVT